MRRILATIWLLCVLASAQTQKQAQPKRQSPKQLASSTESGKVSAQNAQQERGRKLLELAEAQASGAQGAMRAFVLWQLARAYEPTDKSKSLELLEAAMTATQERVEESAGTRSRLQQNILQAMVPLVPQRAEELLVQLDADKREPVLNALLGVYEKNNDLDHAIEIVYRIGQEKEIPYQAAGRIMAALPAERNGDLVQLFTVAFGSYRDHEHKDLSLGGSDFGALVTQFWQKLPPNLVHDAIRELLKQAAKSEERTRINISSDNGSAAFGSYYDYRLFQLLPVLEAIDESEAKELLAKNQETKAMLSKYPNGFNSFAPEYASPAKSSADSQKQEKKTGGMGMNISMSRGAGPSAQNVEQEQERRIFAEAAEYPDTALAQAGAISNPIRRANLYQMIAGQAAKKSPSIARAALDKLLAMVDQLDLLPQQIMLSDAAGIYLQMGETEDAKKVIERGFKLADKLQEQDTNADDPNKALKAYWPSAEALRSFTRLASQVSPEWAIAQVNEISDPEMKAMVQTALAQQWLGVSRGMTTIENNRKSGPHGMMVMMGEGQ